MGVLVSQLPALALPTVHTAGGFPLASLALDPPRHSSYDTDASHFVSCATPPDSGGTTGTPAPDAIRGSGVLRGNTFRVGRVNLTSRILTVETIGGTPVQELERRMREINPGRPLLGKDELLLAILAMDNDTVLGNRVTHLQIATPLLTALERLRGIENPEKGLRIELDGNPFLFIRKQGPRLKSPFSDDSSNLDLEMVDLLSGEFGRIHALFAEMIRDYGFFASPTLDLRVFPLGLIYFFRLNDAAKSKYESDPIVQFMRGQSAGLNITTLGQLYRALNLIEAGMITGENSANVTIAEEIRKKIGQDPDLRVNLLRACREILNRNPQQLGVADNLLPELRESEASLMELFAPNRVHHLSLAEFMIRAREMMDLADCAKRETQLILDQIPGLIAKLRQSPEAKLTAELLCYSYAEGLARNSIASLVLNQEGIGRRVNPEPSTPAVMMREFLDVLGHADESLSPNDVAIMFYEYRGWTEIALLMRRGLLRYSIEKNEGDGDSDLTSSINEEDLARLGTKNEGGSVDLTLDGQRYLISRGAEGIVIGIYGKDPVEISRIFMPPVEKRQ